MDPKKKSLLITLALVLVLAVGAVLYKMFGQGGAGLAIYEQSASSFSSPEAASASSAPKNSSSEAQAVAAPDFTVYDGEGQPVTLSSLLDRPAIVNFWASTCPPCRQEMPDFQSAYEEYGDRIAFVMVDGVGSMLNETQEAGAQYVAEQGFTFPVYFDNDRDAVTQYGITAFPTTYFIGADGTVVAGARGMLDAETLEQGISMILPEE